MPALATLIPLVRRKQDNIILLEGDVGFAILEINDKNVMSVIKNVSIEKMELSPDLKFLLLQDNLELKQPILLTLNLKDYKYKSVFDVVTATFGKKDPTTVAVVIKQKNGN